MGEPVKADFYALEYRVNQFRALELDGQPLSMHMGTCQLVNDLWNEVVRLKRLQEERK